MDEQLLEIHNYRFYIIGLILFQPFLQNIYRNLVRAVTILILNQYNNDLFLKYYSCWTK